MFCKSIIICAVVFVFAAITQAQLSNEALERRMAELNKRAATQPAAPVAAGRGRYLKWRAKPDAPKVGKDWVAGFDVLRGVVIAEIDSEVEWERQGGKREEGQLTERLKYREKELAEIKSRNTQVTGLKRDEVVGKSVYVNPVYDPEKVARVNAEKKSVEDEIAPIKRRIGELKYSGYLSEEGKRLAAQKGKIANPAEIPIATLSLVPGRVGYLGVVKVEYVSDERSFAAKWR